MTDYLDLKAKPTTGLSALERSLVPLVAKKGCFDLRLLRKAIRYASIVSDISTFETNVHKYYYDAFNALGLYGNVEVATL